MLTFTVVVPMDLSQASRCPSTVSPWQCTVYHITGRHCLVYLVDDQLYHSRLVFKVMLTFTIITVVLSHADAHRRHYSVLCNNYCSFRDENTVERLFVTC